MKPLYVGAGILLIGLIFLTHAWGTYNSIIVSRNEIDAAWSKVLSAYEQNFVNVAQSAQVAKFSVRAQVNLTLMYAALREGRQLSSTDPTKLNQAVENLDRTAALFFIAVRQEAVPKLDTAQLTELNKVIESTLRVVKFARDNFTDAVKNYNNLILTVPNSIYNNVWGFQRLRGFTPQVEHPPEQNTDIGFSS